ncbi:MAG: hypothetical protein JSW71_10895 [Gemmatimonadota bacterium]|nr:MAG: hypothetical protein JSW71_10895 [Gemmatimonadota bacterium]
MMCRLTSSTVGPVLATMVALATSGALNAQNLTHETLANLRFRTIGPATMSGRIVDIAVVEANTYTFYVASATGGVWKTTNNGITFTPVFEREGTHSVGAIAVHQVDTNIVWVGTGERANRQSSSWGDGVYKSTDGGETWTNTGLDDSHHIGRIALHPTDPDIVFVAAMGHLWGPNDERGLYMSTDGGATWTRVLSGDEATGVVDVAIDWFDPNIVYAAKYQRRRRPYGFHGGGPGSGLYKSSDGGATWRELTNGLPEGDIGRIGISIYRSDPRIVYVSVEQGWRYNASTQYGEYRAGVYRSEDKGETWQHMSTWNPRPMYASQPLVDPNDDQRIYMVNSYSFSDDGGKTFTRPRQSLHGDDRLVWVDPHDSRHVLKADDGGLGISYDRGLSWIYATHLPVSQFYRVGVDMSNPYWVYGGLQDNGSWMGPSATYNSEGVRFEDWIKTGGGDGFVNLVDTTDNATLYTESQYLGLSRVDIKSGARVWIRPDNARGAISARRNWDAWGPGLPEPELGNAMAPANWDGPFIISPHDNNTLYAGTNQLWKSSDRGNTWLSLGDLTTGVNRRELRIMGQRPHDSTLSLDDGIPYYPTLSAIAESPLRQGLLYAGTDDGNLQVSLDDGQSWQNVVDRLPGLPASSWISGIEPSRFDEGTVYVAINNYRNDDYSNYLFRSSDFGQTWTSIVGDLPADRVTRTIREDLRNPDVLYLGTELGLFYSNDNGVHWVELKGNMPTMAFNDLVLHPRDNDLVLASHSQGIWILDNANALQELTPEVLRAEAHLFTIEPAEMIRYQGAGGHTGDVVFMGENPPAGAIIDYYLSEERDPQQVTVSIHDDSGREINRTRATARSGVNRVVWNLRHANIGMPDDVDRGRGMEGPWVLPGQYTVRLQVGTQRFAQTVEVLEDPRIEVTDPQRADWHERVMSLAETVQSFLVTADTVAKIKQHVDGLSEQQRAGIRNLVTEVDDIAPLVGELRSRLMRLYGQVSEWPAPLTADQQSQTDYVGQWIRRLEPRVRRVVAAELP